MLDLSDFVDVLERDFAACLVAGVHGAAQTVLPGLHVGGIEQEIRGGRGAKIEGEGPIGANGDARRNGDSGVDVGSAGVEFLSSTISCDSMLKRAESAHLAEVHALDTLTTQSRTDGRTGRGLAGADNQLDELILGQNVLSHDECRLLMVDATGRKELKTEVFQDLGIGR